MAYLTAGQQALGDHLPLDIAVGIPMLLFLVGTQSLFSHQVSAMKQARLLQIMELHFSYHGVLGFIRAQTADFYRLCQEEGWAGAIAGARARGSLPPAAVEVVLRALDQQRRARQPASANDPALFNPAMAGQSDQYRPGVAMIPDGVGGQAASAVTPLEVAWEGARLLSDPLAMQQPRQQGMPPQPYPYPYPY